MKIVVITGPTSSGKSDLAVHLAKKFNGEIISADSRQVYKRLDIGSGKITKEEMEGVPHHLLDVVNPQKRFSVNEYEKMADKVIKDTLERNKLPIICGGTGYYIQSIVDGIILPKVKPNEELRKELERKTTKELFEILKKLSPKRATTIEKENKRRLIRAIEIAKKLGNVPEIKKDCKYEALQIGIKTEDKELRERINKRLLKRIDMGMIKEVEGLNLSWKRLEELGLEYKYVSRYLRNILSKENMIRELENKIWQYSRRQMVWFRKDKRIKWFKRDEFDSIEKEVENFLRKS